MTLSRRAAILAAALALGALVLTGIITARVTLAIEHRLVSTCLVSLDQLSPAQVTRCSESYPNFGVVQAQAATFAGLADQAAREQDADRKRQADLEREVGRLQRALDQLTD
jgi:hypothetical protein